MSLLAKVGCWTITRSPLGSNSDIGADARPLDDDAADDLERICDHIAESRPESARKVAKTIVDGVGILELFPNRGRAGRVEATREFVFASLPFVAIHEVHGDSVQVLRILHGAQRWPQLPEWTGTE